MVTKNSAIKTGVYSYVGNNYITRNMKQLKTILLTLVGALTIIACKNEQGKINKEQTENNEASSIENPIQEEQNIDISKNFDITKYNV